MSWLGWVSLGWLGWDSLGWFKWVSLGWVQMDCRVSFGLSMLGWVNMGNTGFLRINSKLNDLKVKIHIVIIPEERS